MIIRLPKVRILVDKNLVKTSLKEWARPCYFSRTGLQSTQTKNSFGTDQADVFR